MLTALLLQQPPPSWWPPSAWDSNWAIFLVTLAMLVVAALEWRSNRASAKHTAIIERAYVGMSHVSPGLVCFTEGLSTNPPAVPFGPDNHPGVVVQITNHGHTPANVLAATVAAYVGTELPKKRPYSDYKDWGAFFLMPGDTFLVRRIVSTPLTSEQFLSLQDGSLKMWILGYVDYTDSFGAGHRTGYARRYSPTSPENNLVFETTPGYNYDSDRK